MKEAFSVGVPMKQVCLHLGSDVLQNVRTTSCGRCAIVLLAEDRTDADSREFRAHQLLELLARQRRKLLPECHFTF